MEQLTQKVCYWSSPCVLHFLTGVLAALLLPAIPGSGLLAIAVAAGAPYVHTRVWAAWAGWASLSLAAKIGAGLSGEGDSGWPSST